MNWQDKIAGKVTSIPPSGIRRFFDIVSEMNDVITLGIGEPDFTTPWHIKQACIEGLRRGFTSYTGNSGLLELRQAICRDIGRRFDLDYDPVSQALITVGVSEALDLAMRAILNPGDEVIIVEPCFVSYRGVILLADGRPVAVCARPENDFMVTAGDLAAAITPRTKAILIGYPSNPTGAVMTRTEMERIARLVREHDLILVSDEIYADLTYEGEHCCAATLPGLHERTLLLNGLSKSHAMTGWRIGYALGPAELIAAMTKIHQYTIMCAPTMSQTAAVEAVENGRESVRQMVEEYNARRVMVMDMVRAIGLKCVEPRGAFYVFPSIAETGLSSLDFCERLLIEERVAVVPGTAFGECGEGFVRCCYAASRRNLQEAFTRIGNFVGRLTSG
ncbi:MAG: aminotransferase class I/II-fold pyridoxal phosphate-dependent enzyme [Negativicutes bacterium]|nr:aminotransferase class I/II-fold pyridoxal phosphate-dependent enzyme [Negativicutes bacterium]